LPRRNHLEMSDFDPTQYALRIWRDERKKLKELCEETRRKSTNVAMKPVDPSTRLACSALASQFSQLRQLSNSS